MTIRTTSSHTSAGSDSPPHAPVAGAFATPGLAIFRLTQGLVGLLLGVWLGSAVMAGVAAAVTFRIVRDHRVSVGAEPWNHPLLASDASDILAGAVANGIFTIMGMLGLLCGALALVLIALQVVSLRRWLHRRGNNTSFHLRWVTMAGALGLYLLLVTHLSPTLWEFRNIEYDVTQEPAVREAAKAEIDEFYHPWSERSVLASIALISVALVASPFVCSRLDDQPLARR